MSNLAFIYGENVQNIITLTFCTLNNILAYV